MRTRFSHLIRSVDIILKCIEEYWENFLYLRSKTLKEGQLMAKTKTT